MILRAARKCLERNGCNGCPQKGSDQPCVEIFAEYITKCVDGFIDLETMRETNTHEDVLIVTADGVKGFMWYDEKGKVHIEDGFVFPELRFNRGTVQELISEKGERSAAWTSDTLKGI